MPGWPCSWRYDKNGLWGVQTDRASGGRFYAPKDNPPPVASRRRGTFYQPDLPAGPWDDYLCRRGGRVSTTIADGNGAEPRPPPNFNRPRRNRISPFMA